MFLLSFLYWWSVLTVLQTSYVFVVYYLIYLIKSDATYVLESPHKGLPTNINNCFHVQLLMKEGY